ncbi:MAG TPA: MarR family winged helix-turn-helix transcriptional regulator [Kofleriaceae bacterium]|jgi:DNA-binding MarR family transcriptional regulator
MKPSPAFDELLEQIRLTFFELRRISEDLLADLDCTGAERSLLVELDKLGPRTVPQLARVRAITRQAMQRGVDRVALRRWVESLTNPEHQRSPLIDITPAGRALLAEIHAREVALLGAAKLPIAQAELRRTSATLGELVTYLAGFELRARKGTR